MKKIISTILVLCMLLSCINANALNSAQQTLTVDMGEKTGAMRHGSAGFLYGLGSDGTPNANLLTPLKPGTAVQKAPDGLQHPTGDVQDVARTFMEAGGEQVQVYMQDFYALWGYEYTGMDDYESKVREMVPKIVALRENNPDFKGEIVYIPFNEPDGIWYGNIDASTDVQNRFNADWKRICTVIRTLDTKAKIGGMNLSSYRSGAQEAWMKYCVENSCMADYVTWHELGSGSLDNFKSHLDNYRALEKKYGISEKEIIINEYAPFEDCGVPGKLVNWIALFEENKVSGCLPYWHNAGNLNDLAADNNEPNGAWWLYKWYGDMSGETLRVSTSTARGSLYGLASVDDNKKSALVLLGGANGDTDICLKNINSALPFASSDKVNVKIERTQWTAYHGAAESPSVIMQGTYAVEGGNVLITIPDMDDFSAYKITVTRAGATDVPGAVYCGAWSKKYEAEDAQMVGGAAKSNSDSGQYAYSGGYTVAYIDDASRGFDMSVEVPHDGYYKMDYIYGNGYGLNTSDTAANNPRTVTQTFAVNNADTKRIVLENTLRWSMEGMYSTYIYLSSGKNVLSFRGTSDTPNGASADCVTLTYEGVSLANFDKLYEAEEADFNLLNGMSDTTVTTQNTIAAYSASGYVTGIDKRTVPEGGGVRFTIRVPRCGMYDLMLRYAAEADGEANVYLDNTAATLTNCLTKLKLEKSELFRTVKKTVFLQQGINIIDVDATCAAALDYLRVRENSEYDDKIIEVQAEDATLSGNAQIVENEYAQGGKYVTNMEGGTADAMEISINAPARGSYVIVIRHSGEELFGAHSYNAQVVDRFASYSVNGGAATRVYFKNTFSKENWRPVLVRTEFEAGENTVRFFNDNYRILTCGTGQTGNITYHTLKNYAPHFDSVTFAPCVIEESEGSDNAYQITLMTSEGGKAVLDKNTAEASETVTLTLFPNEDDTKIKVYANGVDVSSAVENNTLSYVVNSNTDLKVRFLQNENTDSYIANNAFGTGDLSQWIVESGKAAVESIYENYAAHLNGKIVSSLSAQKGTYTLSLRAKGEGQLIVGVGDVQKEYLLSSAWQTYSLRADIDGAAELFAQGSEAYVDAFTLQKINIDENLLYFVDCGDYNPQTLSDGDAFGIYNSVTEQFFSVDEVTGKMWGIDDEYTPNSAHPNLLTGKDTWPYEGITSDTSDKILTFRYARSQNDVTGAGLTYKFELPTAGDYLFELGLYQPSGAWSANSRQATVRVNDEVLFKSVRPSNNADDPVIIKGRASVNDTMATLNIKPDYDGCGGPMISYIKVSAAQAAALEGSEIAITEGQISGSATWSNKTTTVAKYAFDGNTSTFFDGIVGGWCIVDLGEEYSIGAIEFLPREAYPARMYQTAFWVSNDNSTWEMLYKIAFTPDIATVTKAVADNFLTSGAWRYVKYQNLYDYCNVSEIKLYGAKDSDYSAYVTKNGNTVNVKVDSFKPGTSAYVVCAAYDNELLREVHSAVLEKAGDVPFTFEETPQEIRVFIWKSDDKMVPLNGHVEYAH